MNYQLAKTQNGFTIPELLMTITITALLSGLILAFAFNFWRSAATSQAELDTFSERLDADDSLRSGIEVSNGLIIQNSLPDSHTNNPDPNIASKLFWLPLHAIPGNYTVGAIGTTKPLLYYKSPSINKSKAIILNGAAPYDDEYILYLNGTTRQMLLRTLANTTASNNRATTSCPPAQTSSSCPADRVIVNNLDSVDLRYFSRSGNLIDWTSIWDPNINNYAGPDFPVVEAVEFDLHLSQKAAFNGTNSAVNQTIIRIALRNT